MPSSQKRRKKTFVRDVTARRYTVLGVSKCRLGGGDIVKQNGWVDHGEVLRLQGFAVGEIRLKVFLFDRTVRSPVKWIST